MQFFKKLFGKKKPTETQEQYVNQRLQHAGVNEIATEEYFNKRYQEETVAPEMLDGALKMIESYFIDNKIERPVAAPINHPKNLDETMDEGFGFVLYCKAMQMDESLAAGILAMAFNDFMIKNHGFKLYKDNEPEFPLRSMTLKYDNQGAKLSLYPIKYAAKVINYAGSFNDLYGQVKTGLENMPTSEDVLKNMLGEE